MSRWMLAALALAVAACRGPWVPVATEADAARANVAVAELHHGRQLLLSHCSGCHQTPSPRDATIADWPSEVEDMRERSSLEPEEAAAITRYLIAFAELPTK